MNTEKQSARRSESVAEFQLRSGPVLLVDDSDDIRDVFKIWVELEGFPIHTERSAVDALNKIKDGSLEPSLVFVDLSMPDMSGQDFIKELRASGFLPEVPVFIFSAHSHNKLVDGANGWVRKPVDLEQVLTLISQTTKPQ